MARPNAKWIPNLARAASALALCGFLQGFVACRSARVAPPERPSQARPQGRGQDLDPAANWPRFRGPNGSGVAASPDAPTKWNGRTREGILWKTRVPLPGYSSPVVWGDGVYLSGADRKVREVYCFDADTGKLRWRRRIERVPGSAPGPSKVWQEGSYAAPTVATDGRVVCAVFANGDVACLDTEGQPIWTRNLGVAENTYGHSSSPILVRDRLVVQRDEGLADERKSRLMALDVRTGKTLWETPRAVSASWGTPILVGPQGHEQVVASGVPWVAAYDAGTGAEVWRAECMTGGLWAAPSPICADGKVVAAVQGAVLAVIRPDGKGDVTKSHVAWAIADEDLPSASTPVCDGALIFLLGTERILVCFDAQNRQRLWGHEFPEGKGTFQASPIRVGDRLYILESTGRMYLVKAAREYQELGQAELGETCPGATPAVKDGRIYIRAKASLYCIGKRP